MNGCRIKTIKINAIDTIVNDLLNISFVFDKASQPDETIKGLEDSLPAMKKWTGTIKMDVSFEKCVYASKDNAMAYMVELASGAGCDSAYRAKGEIETGFIDPSLLVDALVKIDDPQARTLARVVSEDFKRGSDKAHTTKLEIMSILYNASGVSRKMMDAICSYRLLEEVEEKLNDSIAEEAWALKSLAELDQGGNESEDEFDGLSFEEAAKLAVLYDADMDSE